MDTTRTVRALRPIDVHVRLTVEEKTILLRAAQREGRNLANFLRYHGLVAAKTTGPQETKEMPA